VRLNENAGPGMARQLGIDIAEGEYVMFCDADDVLHNVLVLGILFNEIEGKKPDICITSWLEELITPQNMVYLEHKLEATWMHGKIIRKKYLADNGIQFHPALRVHEDSYFLGLAFELTDNKTFIDSVTYLWKYNTQSITRKDNSIYTYDSFSTFIQAISMLIDELRIRNANSISFKVCQLVLYTFFTMQLDHWMRDEVAVYKKEAEKTIGEVLEKNRVDFANYPHQKFLELYNNERTNILVKNNCIEKETFDVFLNRISNRQN
jgi:glycosyltransferase involved in cell wall biosynthesis